MSLDTSNLPSDAEIAQMFDAVPILERHGVADKTLRAGAAPVVQRARRLAPRSNQDDRDKRSAKQKASADWNFPLWKTIKQVVRKYDADGFAVVGPEYPKGNKAYFNTSPDGRIRKLWGHLPKSLSVIVPQIRNWIVRAFDETREAQLGAMKKKLQSLMDDIWRK